MRRNHLLSLVVMAIGLVMVLALSGTVYAGDFHRLVGTLADGGGTNCTYTTPKNSATAMEMDVFEFQAPVGDSYRCCITANSTGQDLFVRMIGLTGSPLASFTTPVNGTGCTAYIGTGAGFVFQCTVATGAGSPVNGGVYRVCAQRQ